MMISGARTRQVLPVPNTDLPAMSQAREWYSSLVRCLQFYSNHSERTCESFQVEGQVNAETDRDAGGVTGATGTVENVPRLLQAAAGEVLQQRLDTGWD